MTYVDALSQHHKLSERRVASQRRREQVAQALKKKGSLSDVSVFCAGSLARDELGRHSDLDLFVLATEKQPHLKEISIFSDLIQLNDELSFPPLSNDGQYLQVHTIDRLKETTGQPRDDSENTFTTRMLLVLEGKPLTSEAVFRSALSEIIDLYFRDNKDNVDDFRPMFLLNDVLRYWRTLCLNYETIRHNAARPWRKKNIALKFSRMLTVFATVLPVVARPIKTADAMIEFCEQSPLERLASGLDALGTDSLKDEWLEVLDMYEYFLALKEEEDEAKLTAAKEEVDDKAVRFADFLYRALNSESIDVFYRRFLVL